MPACSVRSALTAPRPISTPTSPRIATSISRTITSWSTFRTRTSCCRRCRKCPKATRSPASTWSCGCARSAEPRRPCESRAHNHRCLLFSEGVCCRASSMNHAVWVPAPDAQLRIWAGTTAYSLHLLIGVNAPQPLLLDPAVKAIAGDAAPAGRAFLDLGHDAGLQPRGNRAARIGTIVEWREFVLGLHDDDCGAAARHQRMIDPTFGASGIAHPAPIFELGGDFDRKARAGVDPGDVIVLGRSGPDIHMIGFEADVTRHRQAAGGDGRILGRKSRADGRAKPATPHHRHHTEPPERH